VVNASKSLPAASTGVVHHIQTTGPPLSCRFRRLDGEKLQAAKAEFSQLEKEGIVRRSNSPWSSPLHMVPKGDGTWRPCGDFRRLNLVTVPDAYPLPNMQDFSVKAAGCNIFSKIDLRKGYHQVAVNPDDVPKTAISTPFGLFEYLRMPFGLRNSGNTFQPHMDRVVSGLNSVFAYLDDVLVSSADETQHAADLRQLFCRLREHGLVINAEKCLFGVKELDFLGHRVSAAGASPLPAYVEAVESFPPPSTVKETQQFLGLVNFYRRFLPGLAATLKPLTDTLRRTKKGTDAVPWTGDKEAAFTAAKKMLAAATRLAHPNPAAQLSLAVDASATHVGASLQQKSPGSAAWEPLGFYSKKLDTTQVKYSAFDRELLAIYLGIRHFRYMLEGRRFVVLTDHKPLTHALARTTDAWTARQCRQLSYVAEFTSDIRHLKGTDNVVADALSRPPASPPAVQVAAVAPPPSLPFTPASLAAAQASCADVAALTRSESLDVRHVVWDSSSVLCDFSSGVKRPLVPTALRRSVFDSVHSLAHPGARATRRLISSRYVWRGLASDIRLWCRDCQACQRAKITQQPPSPIQPIAVPTQRFTHLHIDLVGPLPASRDGLKYLLTMVDRSTRWLEAVPLKDMEATTVADAFTREWLPRFGVPACITSDRGTQFSSSTWSGLCERLGIQHISTTAYHPQANGMVERSHRQLKNALRARLAAADWPDHLPWVLLGLRSAPKEESGVSSAELVLGQPLSLPGEFVDADEPPAVAFLEKMRISKLPPPPTRPLTYAQVASRPSPGLATAEFVYVRRGGVGPPLAPPYAGPYQVIARQPKFFKLKMGGKEEVVSIDRLKPHLGPSPVDPASPPRRGRPALPPPSLSASTLGGAPVAAPPK
jgi:cleavage and polyadenylation specificity factor subunit 1